MSEYTANGPRLEVKEQCTGDVVIVVGLVEENVLAIATLERVEGEGVFSSSAVSLHAVCGIRPRQLSC